MFWPLLKTHCKCGREPSTVRALGGQVVNVCEHALLLCGQKIFPSSPDGEGKSMEL